MSMIDLMNYHADHRVRGGRAAEDRRFDEDRMILTFTVENEDGEEYDAEIPARFEVCWTCDGKGRHVNPSIDSNGLTAEDFAEDPDFAEEYMSGAYDVTCYGCGGRRVVPVPDEGRCDEAQKRNLKLAEDAAADRAAMEAEMAAERRMGC